MMAIASRPEIAKFKPRCCLAKDPVLGPAEAQLVAIVDAGNALRDLVMDPASGDSPVSQVVAKARLTVAQMLIDLEKAVA